MPDFQYNQAHEDLETDLEGIMESQSSQQPETAEEVSEPETEDSGLARIVRGDLPSADVQQTVEQATPPAESAFREHKVREMLQARKNQDLAGKVAVHHFLNTAQ